MRPRPKCCTGYGLKILVPPSTTPWHDRERLACDQNAMSVVQFTPRKSRLTHAINTARAVIPVARKLFSAYKSYQGSRRKRKIPMRPKGRTVAIKAQGQIGQRVVNQKRRRRGRTSLRQKVMRLAKRCKTSTHIYRTFLGGGFAANENLWGELSMIAWNRSYLLTAMSQIADPIQTPAGIDQLRGVDRTATNSRINFKCDASCFATLEIRNNSLVEQEIYVYTVDCVQNTNDSPQTILSNLYADTYYNVVSSLNLGVYPSEVMGFQRYYKIIKSNRFTLNPGDSAKLYSRQLIKGLDPKQLSQSTLLNTAKRCRQFYVRARGGVAGQAGTDNQAGRGKTSIDMIVQTNIKLMFDGAGTKTIRVDVNGLGAVDEIVSVNQPLPELT